MFGYIRIQKSELLVREYEAYKSVYCGLCRQMGRDYSRLSRFILSYDCTFYAMLLMSLRRSCEGFERKCCRFNPLKRCTYCNAEDDALSKAAALSVILAYYKIVDDIEDSGFWGRTAYRIVKPIFARWRKKAARRYPELDKIAADMTAAQQLAEKDSNCPLDKAADPSATMLSSVLELEAESDVQKRIYGQIGYGIGRFIYLIDAADDLEKDIKNSNFNPFIGINDRNNVIKNNLSQALAMTFDAYNLLDLVDFKGIIDNVITKGLPTVQNEILAKISE